MKRSLFDRLKKDMQRGEWSFKQVTAIVVFGLIILVFVFLGMT